jgi:hypothetical protein
MRTMERLCSKRIMATERSSDAAVDSTIFHAVGYDDPNPTHLVHVGENHFDRLTHTQREDHSLTSLCLRSCRLDMNPLSQAVCVACHANDRAAA